MKKVGFFIFYLIIGYVSSFTSQAFAQNFSTEELELHIKNYVHELYIDENTTKDAKLQVSKPMIKSRTPTHECNTDIKLDILHKNGRNINIKVSCLEPTPWRIYIPLKVTKLLPVLVSTSNLSKGTVLTKVNTKINLIEEHKIRGATLNKNKSVLGAKLKRNLQKESTIYSSHICTVCKGEMVTIIASSSGFKIKTQGTALSNGNIGEQVSVKNSSSGNIISAHVSSVNKVVINL